jgi:hypothetical protein
MEEMRSLAGQRASSAGRLGLRGWSTMKSNVIEDPVSRVRMRFEPKGENPVVDNWIAPSGGLAAHLHPRQEERWGVVEGTVGFRFGDEERPIGPEDGEIVVPPGPTPIPNRATSTPTWRRSTPPLHRAPRW